MGQSIGGENRRTLLIGATRDESELGGGRLYAYAALDFRYEVGRERASAGAGQDLLLSASELSH